jgi:hypothetical protein
MSLSKVSFTPEHYLNTALCQSPPGVSKTKKAMNYIKFIGLMSRFNAGSVENGIHHMTLISTNRNLEETKQWKFRSERDLKGLNILVLSSRKGDTNNVQHIISKLAQARTANHLPDVIIFCTHQKRMDDMITLLRTLNNGNMDFSRIGVKQITTTCMFDEADANIKLIANFLNDVNGVIHEGGNYDMNYVLRDIHYITATPFKEFWKRLEEVGVTVLKNVNDKIRNADPDSQLHMSYESIMNEYRHIDEHTIHCDNDDKTDEPHIYAADIVKRLINQRDRGERLGPFTIFAPAKMEIESHNAMLNMISYPHSSFTVAINNSERKGFYNAATGTFTSFHEYSPKTYASGEFKDILVEWRRNNPEKDLLITGFLNIQRGVTFCTKGFNFTDLIISSYHLKNMQSLVQILGRANGGKEYVQIMNIWCPKHVIDKARIQIEIINSLLNQELEEFKESHFCEKSKLETNEPAMTVPVIITLTSEEYQSIGKIGRSWNEDTIKGFIRQYKPEIAVALDEGEFKKDQITEPKEESAIKKQIQPLVHGAETNKKSMTSIKKEHRKENMYQVFLDKANTRLIVSLYYGTRLSEDSDEST